MPSLTTPVASAGGGFTLGSYARNATSARSLMLSGIWRMKKVHCENYGLSFEKDTVKIFNPKKTLNSCNNCFVREENYITFSKKRRCAKIII